MSDRIIMNIPDDIYFWYDDTADFWWRSISANPDGTDVRVDGKDRRCNPNLQPLSRYIDANFDRIEPRIIEYLTQIQEIKIEHHPASDLSECQELRDPSQWQILEIELLDIDRFDCYEVVCHNTSNWSWLYVCFLVLIQRDVPIGVRGRYW
ncbi:hypothetical protein [Chamaesiphon sp. OTE_75_metabat_556]|uniref:hypothetical protein n=1 Tax=Chamaesiphon sp. OTE_75_metabat_556 TaxID=2964692 RepID=UPI00286CB661|nr:hypothetical protein [Chamaesiphon sp. OTE_75_metabat_556]